MQELWQRGEIEMGKKKLCLVPFRYCVQGTRCMHALQKMQIDSGSCESLALMNLQRLYLAAQGER